MTKKAKIMIPKLRVAGSSPVFRSNVKALNFSNNMW